MLCEYIVITRVLKTASQILDIKMFNLLKGLYYEHGAQSQFSLQRKQ